MSMDINELPIGQVLTSALIDNDRVGLTFRAPDDVEEMTGKQTIIWIEAKLAVDVEALRCVEIIEVDHEPPMQ